MSEDEKEETPKFEEAQDAGTENGHLCTLILADGWTAAEVSVAGLSVLGRKRFGMYRLLNVTKEAKHKTIANIPEIVDLMKIIGLQHSAHYSTESQWKTLRYGKLMMLTDQNVFGTNFKGLFIYFIYTNWPHLLRRPFLEEFITPVVRVTSGEIKKLFFSLAEFEDWKLGRADTGTYAVKHYMGLGTNTWSEVKEYFSNMDHHRVTFACSGPEDDLHITKAFDVDAIEQRREWLIQHMKESESNGLQDIRLYSGKTNEITLSDFINLEYVFFANFDNFRSIPTLADGLTPGQRKVLFTCTKCQYESEVKVARLACSVAEEAAYYEGEQTICKIVYGMAQDYIGSNNINLLTPFGQFGTRLMGGEDCADQFSTSAMMSTITKFIFHPHDDPLLSYNCSNGNQKIEPQWYIPIIPMILVNGSEGTGTGWFTNIPKYDPHQIIRCLRDMIAGRMPNVLTPYYRHFRGTILPLGGGLFISIGCLAVIAGDKIEITELPVGTWTLTYKETVLKRLLNESETTRPVITDYKEYDTDTTVRFIITFAPGQFDKLRNEVGGFHKIFQLYGFIRTDNMHAFDSGNCLRKYESADDILKEFYQLRLEYYVKRRKYLESKLTAEANKLSNQVRFILEKTSNRLVIANKPWKTVTAELNELGYQCDPVEKWKRENGIETNCDGKMEELRQLSNEERTDEWKYDYLLNMSMWMLTEERKNELINRRDEKLSELRELRNQTEYDLWLSDLRELENKLNEVGEEKERNHLDYKDLYPSVDGENVELNITDAFVEQLLLLEHNK